MPDTKTKDFAATGTESYTIPEQEAKKDHIVLNITEEKPAPAGVVLETERKKKERETGNVIFDFFRKLNRYFVRHTKVKSKDKATFFHLLSVMINAGMPIIKALHSLTSQLDKNPKLQLVIEKIADDIESGMSLSEAFLNNPDVFTEQEIGMAQAGEASGQLSKVLENLAKDTEKTQRIKSKIKSAMMYPAVLFTLLVGVVAAMMIYVIPTLKGLFESNKVGLPLITRIVVGISDFMVEQKLFLMAGILVLILSFMILKRTDVGRYAFDKFKITVPLFGPLFKKAYLSRFSRSLSNLLDSSVSIVKAIEITANSIGNDVYRKRLFLSMEDVKQGIPLAESISESELFPVMLVNMFDVGEKTAQLDKITEKVADFYEDEVDTAVNGISKLIEPVILIFIGLTIGGVVAAIMLPIMQLSNIAEVL